jgi:HAD superfamily hydrolase (TIGR01509 family)
MKIKAMIFDMDGLLLDTEKHHTRCWREAAKEQGFMMSVDTSLKLRSLAAEYAKPMLLEQFGETLDYERLKREKRKRMDQVLSEHPLEVKEGARELLTFLSDKKCKKAVATATRKEKAEQFLKTTGLWEYFDEVLSVTGVEHGKPMPDIYLEVCRMLGEKPEECVALEDSPNGALAAVRAGCRTILVPDLTPAPQDLKEYLWKEANSLKEVMELIQFDAW